MIDFSKKLLGAIMVIEDCYDIQWLDLVFFFSVE